MLSREQKERSQSEIICIDDLVPENHLMRKIGENKRLKKRFAMRFVVADAGYKTPWIR